MSVQRRITLTQDEDGWWVARERTLSVTTQGPTRTKALENLDEAVTLVTDEDAGRPPTDEELQEWGIDPEKNQTGGDLPEVLR